MTNLCDSEICVE